MQINKIAISNILGINEMEFKAGKYIEISGKNGVGKTSIIEAIKAAIGHGANNATLLRNGAKEGEVVLEFDNGDILKQTISDKSDIKMTDCNGKKIKNVPTLLKQLTDILSVNPIQFLTAAPKDRAKYLLEALNINVEDKELESNLIGYAKEICKELSKQNFEDGLVKISEYRDKIYKERTGVNRDFKTKEITINQLEETIQGFDIVPGIVESEIEDLEAKQKERLAKRETALQQLQERFQAEKDNLIAKFDSYYNPAEQELATLREKLKTIGAINNTTQLVNQNRVEADELSEKADDLTKSIEALDKLKLSKLNNLPIKGLEVQGTEIFKDGVLFDRLNTAEQMKLAIEVAKLRAGELGIICVDGLERFDNDTYEVFKNTMLETNLQAIITRVSNDELQVKSE